MNEGKNVNSSRMQIPRANKTNASDESNSDENDEKSTQKIPEWAQKEKLIAALSRQTDFNPVPTVFPEFIATCDLSGKGLMLPCYIYIYIYIYREREREREIC